MDTVLENDEARMGDAAAMPFADLPEADARPQLAELPPAGETVAPEAAAALSAVQDVPVKVKVVLGRARMSIERLLDVKAGAVVELDRRVGEPVDVYVNDRLIARGEVVMIDSALGVTLTEVVRQDS